MADLRFPLAGVRRLAAATRAAATHEPTFAQRELASEEVPVGFWLVKDAGVYLLPNGDRTRHEPVYAEGLGPDAGYDRIRAVAGGDDFCEFVPLAWADWTEEAVRRDPLRDAATHLVVRLSPTSLRLRPPAFAVPAGPAVKEPVRQRRRYTGGSPSAGPPKRLGPIGRPP